MGVFENDVSSLVAVDEDIKSNGAKEKKFFTRK